MAALASPGRDGVQPRRWRGPAIELLPTAKRLQEDVLHQVVRFVGVAAEPHAEPVQPSPVLLEQATDRHLGGLLHLLILPCIRRTCNVGGELSERGQERIKRDVLIRTTTPPPTLCSG